MITRTMLVIAVLCGTAGCGPSEAEIGACKASKLSHATSWSKYSQEVGKRKENIKMRTDFAQISAESSEKYVAEKPDASEKRKADAKRGRAQAVAFKAEMDAYDEAGKAADAAATAEAMKASEARASSERAFEAAKAAGSASSASAKLIDEEYAGALKELRDHTGEEQKLYDRMPAAVKQTPRFQKLVERAADSAREFKKKTDDMEKEQRANADADVARIKELVDLATAADKASSEAVTACAKIDK
jgi:hypothetical protein